jgi:hypothetical protein
MQIHLRFFQSSSTALLPFLFMQCVLPFFLHSLCALEYIHLFLPSLVPYRTFLLEVYDWGSGGSNHSSLSRSLFARCLDTLLVQEVS